MKYSILFLLCCCYCFVSGQQTSKLAIIPEPNSLQQSNESFQLTRNSTLQYNDSEAKEIAELLNALLWSNYGFRLPLKASTTTPRTGAVTIRKENLGGFTSMLEQRAKTPEVWLLGAVTIVHDKNSKRETYTLAIGKNGISIRGDEAGIFYALQTLRQLFPVQKTTSIRLPGVQIVDSPRFVYRGLMLDVSRHFFPVSYIKKFLDLMSQHKLNTFHWHLTDDQGWRIEIPKHPKLQQLAAWRKPGALENNSPHIKNGRYGGYYTHAEIRQVVAYARTLHIDVIPEIEMPGHSNAALAAYPELGCKAGTYEVMTHGGISKNVYCAGNDSVFEFLQDVIDEVVKLFPGKYIHIGGDETPKDSWQQCPKCQARKKAAGLKDEHELQSYFVQRMEKYINGKGRTMIGWDEILEGGLAPNATVMSWRGETGGIEAARLQHDVIMTPYTYVYFDYHQGKPETEPRPVGAYLPLSTVYSYEPLPAVLTAEQQSYIKGVQANTWAEVIPNESHMDYMVYPRALALAEIGWSKPEKKNYDYFLQKLAKRLAALDRQQVHFRIPEPFGLKDSVTVDKQLTMNLQPAVENAVLYYTTDGSTPVARNHRPTNKIDLSLVENVPITVKTLTVLPSGRQSAVYTATYVYKRL